MREEREEGVWDVGGEYWGLFTQQGRAGDVGGEGEELVGASRGARERSGVCPQAALGLYCGEASGDGGGTDVFFGPTASRRELRRVRSGPGEAWKIVQWS